MAPWMDAPGGFGMKFNGQPIATLTGLLTQATGRIVQDQTGLKGNYDYQLAMDPQFLMQMMSQLGVSMPANVTLPGSENPAILTAIQEQLGVKAESRRGPVDILVIESAEKPGAMVVHNSMLSASARSRTSCGSWMSLGLILLTTSSAR